MAYVLFDPGFTRHRKCSIRTAAANWLWVCAIDHCVKHMTHGTLTDLELRKLPQYTAKLRDELVETRSLERHEDGMWYVHDIEQWQTPSEIVKAKQDDNRARQRKWYKSHRQTGTQGQPNAEPNALGHPPYNALGTTEPNALPNALHSRARVTASSSASASPELQVGDSYTSSSRAPAAEDPPAAPSSPPGDPTERAPTPPLSGPSPAATERAPVEFPPVDEDELQRHEERKRAALQALQGKGLQA